MMLNYSNKDLRCLMAHLRMGLSYGGADHFKVIDYGFARATVV